MEAAVTVSPDGNENFPELSQMTKEKFGTEFEFPADMHLPDFNYLLSHPEGHQILQTLIEAASIVSRRRGAARGAPV